MLIALAFPTPDLELARTQWLVELDNRLSLLNSMIDATAGDLEYGGAASQSHDLAPLEGAVDEARRMVYSLGGEMRRRSEGMCPAWLKAQPVIMPRTTSSGI